MDHAIVDSPVHASRSPTATPATALPTPRQPAANSPTDSASTTPDWCPGATPPRSPPPLLGDRERADDSHARDSNARAGGIPRTIGLALRTAALVNGGRTAPELLDEAVQRVLQRSPSTLALAHALVDQGAQLRRAGQRTAAQRAPAPRP